MQLCYFCLMSTYTQYIPTTNIQLATGYYATYVEDDGRIWYSAIVGFVLCRLVDTPQTGYRGKLQPDSFAVCGLEVGDMGLDVCEETSGFHGYVYSPDGHPSGGQ